MLTSENEVFYGTFPFVNRLQRRPYKTNICSKENEWQYKKNPVHYGHTLELCRDNDILLHESSNISHIF